MVMVTLREGINRNVGPSFRSGRVQSAICREAPHSDTGESRHRALRAFVPAAFILQIVGRP
jgi:hypothetical protein